MNIRFDNRKAYRWSIVMIVGYIGLLLFVNAAAASDTGMSLVEYVKTRGIPASAYVVLAFLLIFAAVPLIGVREYRVDETGVTLFMRLKKRTRTIAWEELAFVGPAYVGEGRFRQKQLVYSRELPRKGRPGEKAFVVNGKTAYTLQDSPEMREALRRYCPVYTEEYENVT